jgi:hypothetical protein
MPLARRMGPLQQQKSADMMGEKQVPKQVNSMSSMAKDMQHMPK